MLVYALVLKTSLQFRRWLAKRAHKKALALALQQREVKRPSLEKFRPSVSHRKTIRRTSLIKITEEDVDQEDSDESTKSIQLRELRKNLCLTDFRRRVRNDESIESMDDMLMSARSFDSRNYSSASLMIESQLSMQGYDSNRSRQNSGARALELFKS